MPLKKILSGYLVTFNKQLQSRQRLSEKNIHDLRVSVKNMRSLLRLCKRTRVKKHTRKEFLAFLRPVFKNAGELRSMVVNLQTAKKLKLDGLRQYSAYIQKQQTLHRKSMRETLLKFDNRVFNTLSGELLSEIKQVSKKDMIAGAETEIIKKLKQLWAQVKHRKAEDQLHQVRKDLKDIKTIGNFMRDAGVRKFSKGRLKKVKSAEHLIGNWHDREVLEKDLRKFNEKNKRNKKLRVASDKLKKDNAAAGKKLVKELRRIFN